MRWNNQFSVSRDAGLMWSLRGRQWLIALPREVPPAVAEDQYQWPHTGQRCSIVDATCDGGVNKASLGTDRGIQRRNSYVQRRPHFKRLYMYFGSVWKGYTNVDNRKMLPDVDPSAWMSFLLLLFRTLLLNYMPRPLPSYCLRRLSTRRKKWTCSFFIVVESKPNCNSRFTYGFPSVEQRKLYRGPE